MQFTGKVVLNQINEGKLKSPHTIILELGLFS